MGASQLPIFFLMVKVKLGPRYFQLPMIAPVDICSYVFLVALGKIQETDNGSVWCCLACFASGILEGERPTLAIRMWTCKGRMMMTIL